MNNTDKVRRDILPIPDQPFTGLIIYDAKDADHFVSPEERFQVYMAIQ